MNHQSVRILNLSDLRRFRRYVRSNRIHGIVRQNQFAVNARNTFMLALALPLEAAALEITGTQTESLRPFESRSCPALK